MLIELPDALIETINITRETCNNIQQGNSSPDVNSEQLNKICNNLSQVVITVTELQQSILHLISVIESKGGRVTEEERDIFLQIYKPR